jgi:signal transduction histidine kinase
MQVLTTIIVLGLCIAAFVYTDIKGYKERKVKSITAIAQVVASSNVTSLVFDDANTARKSLSGLEQQESGIVNAAILDSTGRVFTSYNVKGQKPYAFTPLRSNIAYFTDNYLYVYNIVTNENDNNKAIGVVCLRVELSQLQKIKGDLLKIAFVLLIIGIALAFLIAVINQRSISNPLLYLVKVMRQIRQSEDYKHHVNVKGKDEIAILSQEFNNLMDEVVRSHQKKDEFIGVASHELKTPLTSVKAYLQLLEKIEQQEPNLTYVTKAQENVNKLQKLIFDLLDVSKIQAGQLQLELKEFNISELIMASIHDAQLGTTKHTITKVGGMTNAIIAADRNRIEQVVVNLLSNAIKYSPTGKEIIVTSKRADGEVVVSIKDFGVGIPKADQQKIFERFYRAGSGLFGISGFGLGLYICHEIIKRHGGKIWVESEGIEGKGSTFHFSLPTNN